MVVPGHDQARDRVEQKIIEAEHFKAAIANPPGNVNGNLLNLDNLMMRDDDHDVINKQIGFIADKQQGTSVSEGKSDDDFYHMTCHIDKHMITKIENGDYVDLEKLLPKMRGKIHRHGDGASGNILQWIQKDGGTYLAPAPDKDNTINSIRRWEQAFRLYATIYCGVNPKRSKEVWQYIDDINNAATTFIWENVYNYDVTFRHLMEFNPSRSWAVTYTKMWNLCMKERIPSRQNNNYNWSGNSNHNYSHGNNGGSGSSGGYAGGNGSSGKKKSDHCWSFNKGIKCQFGKNCKFIECCSYCDSVAHGIVNCPKADKKDKERMLKK